MEFQLQVGDVMTVLHVPTFGYNLVPPAQSLRVTSLTPRWWFRVTRKPDPKPIELETGIGYRHYSKERRSLSDVNIALRSAHVTVHRPTPEGMVQVWPEVKDAS